jgi:hypothetical protein
MPTGTAALPWWVDALLILMAVVIVVTLIVLATEMIRNVGAGKKSARQPVDHSQLAAPAVNGGDQA